MIKTVPDGWSKSFFSKEVRLLKGSLAKDLCDQQKDGMAPYLLIDGFNGGQYKYTYPNGFACCEKDDPVIVMDGSRSGLVLRGKAGVIGSTLAAVLPISPDKLDKNYLYNILQLLYCYLNKGKTAGAVPHVDRHALMDSPLLLPPISEQHKIASILSSVDDAIDKTRAIIEQSKVVKKAMMQELLTRGIPDRHKKFKKTVVGEIPTEWEVVRVAKVAKFITSGSRGWARYYSKHGAAFIRIGNLTREHINLKVDNLAHVQLPDNSAEGIRTSVSAGDLLISITADLGVIGVVPEEFGEGYVNQHIALVRLDSSLINPRWAGHFLSAEIGQQQFQLLKDSGSKAGLNLRSIAQLNVARPARNEQDEIVNLLDISDSLVNSETIYYGQLLCCKAALLQLLLTGDLRVTVGG